MFLVASVCLATAAENKINFRSSNFLRIKVARRRKTAWETGLSQRANLICGISRSMRAHVESPAGRVEVVGKLPDISSHVAIW